MPIYFADIVDVPGNALKKTVQPWKYIWNKATDHNKRLRSLWDKVSGNSLLKERGLLNQYYDNHGDIIPIMYMGSTLGIGIAALTGPILFPDSSVKMAIIICNSCVFTGTLGTVYLEKWYIASKHDKDAQQMRREKGSFPQNTR